MAASQTENLEALQRRAAELAAKAEALTEAYRRSTWVRFTAVFFPVPFVVVLLVVWFGYGFWGIPGMLLAMPALVALKVAAQYQPSWRTVRDFLTPNGVWQPKSLQRMRGAKEGGSSRKPADAPTPVSRRSA